jgi:DNA gyrase/topoisomerase IV subunit A
VLFDAAEGQHLAALSSGGKLLIFTLDQMKELSGGGRGTVIMGLDEGETLAAACVAQSSLTLLCNTRGGKPVETSVAPRDWEPWLGKRARKGKPAPAAPRPTACAAAEGRPEGQTRAPGRTAQPAPARLRLSPRDEGAPAPSSPRPAHSGACRGSRWRCAHRE